MLPFKFQITIIHQYSACWVKFSAHDILKYFSYFFQKQDGHFMPNICQILFSKKIKKNVISLSSSEYAQSIVKIKIIALKSIYWPSFHAEWFGLMLFADSNPVSILRKSKSGRHRPVRVADGPMTVRCRFT